MTALRRTPLFERHRALGGRLIDFGGWELPVQYPTGIKKEHLTVRSAAGLFDVSHMGEVSVRGAAAADTLQHLVTGDVSKLEDGAALYTLLCNEAGGILDDCIVYRRGAEDYLVIVNAARAADDLAWIREHAGDAEIVDESDDTGLIAVQGPDAVALVDGLSPADLAAVPRFHFARAELAGVPCLVARTGYTGEDGFELAVPADRTAAVWDALLEAGESRGVLPIGLGARDTLRLEARLCLYGSDIDTTTTPYEAGLGWAVKLDAGDFIGRQALAEHKARGPSRKLVGFRIDGRGVARAGYPIVDRSRGDDAHLGAVTSGAPGLSVGGAIGMGYVPTEYAAPGTQLTIDCRGKDVAATVVKGPFYKRS